MKATLQVINQMQADGVIGQYAIGGAVAATFYLEPSATLDIDVFVALNPSPGRGKDFSRTLQFIEAGVLDADRLDQVLTRHQLLAQWEQFGDKFIRKP